MIKGTGIESLETYCQCIDGCYCELKMGGQSTVKFSGMPFMNKSERSRHCLGLSSNNSVF